MTFDQFWQRVWLKVAVGAARKEWAKLKPDQIAIIDSVLDKHTKIQRAKERQFQVHPRRWLKEERWLDEIYEPEKTEAERWIEALYDNGSNDCRPIQCDADGLRGGDNLQEVAGKGDRKSVVQ